MWSSVFRIALIFCLTTSPIVCASKSTKSLALIPQDKTASVDEIINSQATDLSPIVLGQSATLVGNSKEYQQAINNGIAACIKEVNANGGIRGKKVILKLMNNYNNPSMAYQNVQELKAQNIDLFIGLIGTRNIRAILPMVENKEIAVFFPWGCSLDLDRNILPYLINGHTTLKHHIQYLASYLAGCQQHTNIGIVHSDSAFGLVGAKYAEQLIKTFNTQDVTRKVTCFTYNSRNAETDHVVDAINTQKPHALLFLSTGRPTSKIIKGIWNQGNYVQDLVGLESNYSVPGLIDNASAHFRYTRCVPSLSQTEFPIVRDYLTASAKYLPGQTPNTLSLMYYINTRLLMQALDFVVKDKKAITKDTVVAALERIRDVDLGGFIGDFDRKTRLLYPMKISLEECVV